MQNVRLINEDLTYIGCSDRKISLFEGVYPVPHGMSYNSYLLKDEKTVLFDTVDKSCCGQFFENLSYSLENRTLDYVIVHHMEPDHAALLEELVRRYNNVKIVCTTKAKEMIKQFFDFNIEKNALIVKDGDTLNTGKHELQFITAPMVHWPEVMVSYDKYSKILFSADAFGSFGAINGNLFDSEIAFNDVYMPEARRYYTNIVGKYGVQVQSLLKKASGLEIKLICPLHGVLLNQNIKDFIEKYGKWSTYTPEEKGVVAIYSSIYGGTENAINILTSQLSERGIKNIQVYDISQTHPSYVLSEAFKYSNIILATTTYNMEIFETMQNFLHVLISHNLQNRKFSILENGSWAPTCGSQIKTMLEKLKGSEFVGNILRINSSLKKEQLNEIGELADKICESIK